MYSYVRHRESRVGPAYEAHARALDRHFYAGTGTTPFLDRLRLFTTTRGLVFGAYGEASADVHDLLAAAATAQAEREWAPMGARTPTEMRAFLIARLRRRLGCTTVLAYARHRLARVPYIGVPRQSVLQRRELIRPRGGARTPERLPPAALATPGLLRLPGAGPGRGRTGGRLSRGC